MQPMVNLALRAARNAGQDLVRRLDRFDAGQSTDQEKAKFVADCTIGLERSIIFELKKSLPEHNFEGRETGLNVSNEQQPTWQICVIDDVGNPEWHCSASFPDHNGCGGCSAERHGHVRR